MNLWSRMDLIALTNERFLGEYYDFISDYSGGWMIKLFYLIKVNVALWFGWESQPEYDDWHWEWGILERNTDKIGMPQWELVIGQKSVLPSVFSNGNMVSAKTQITNQ